MRKQCEKVEPRGVSRVKFGNAAIGGGGKLKSRSPGCSLIHNVPYKKVVLDEFSGFWFFSPVKILKISLQLA